MFDIQFSKMKGMLKKMKNDKIKAKQRRKTKEMFESVIAAAGGLDELIDYWINNESNADDRNILMLDLLSHYYKLTMRQQYKVDAPITAAKLTGEYDGDISEYI